ncbi:MAG TPA: aminotransferase class V-fold PLP-dependent enzyme [Gammaproteobacteria bacterium]|nr:aminotransferase class V-fold PLP-dependent enzyme [Gammaproteobacteria bacterium]
MFTGCATEANNLAIRGVAAALRDRGRHIITSAIEHPSVAAPFGLLGQQGWDVTVLPVDESGMVNPASVAAALRPDTVLVSVMHANNEVGTIQPISAISAITRPKGIVLHTDAAQSVGKIPVMVDQLGVDLLTIAGHKFYATKGVGAVYFVRWLVSDKEGSVQESPLDILKRRYARGEIGRDTFERMKKDLEP